MEPQSETVWKQANTYGVPRVVFVNKMDRTGADFAACVEQLHAKLGANAVPVQLPNAGGPDFNSVIDLVALRCIIWEEADFGTVYRTEEIPSEMQEAAQAAHVELLERLSDLDDEFMERYLAGEPIPTAEVRAALRRHTVSGEIFPVLCGSAFKNKGIQLLLDAVVDYLPAPTERPPVTGIVPSTGEYVERRPRDDEGLSGAGIQGRDRPLRGPPHLLPHLFRGVAGGFLPAQLVGRRTRTRYPAAAHARQPA